MEPKPFWFQGFQLGSNFIWNQPKIQKNLQKKNLVDWVAREAHGTHGGGQESCWVFPCVLSLTYSLMQMLPTQV